MIIDTDKLRERVTGWSDTALTKIADLETAWGELSAEVEKAGTVAAKVAGTKATKGTIRTVVLKPAEPGHVPRKGIRRDYLLLCKSAPAPFRLADIMPLTGLTKNGVMSLFTRWACMGIIRKVSWGVYEWTPAAKSRLENLDCVVSSPGNLKSQIGDLKVATVKEADAEHLARCGKMGSPFKIADVSRVTGLEPNRVNYLLSKWMRQGHVNKIGFGTYEWTARPAPKATPEPEVVEVRRTRPGAIRLEDMNDSDLPLAVQLESAKRRVDAAKQAHDETMERLWTRRVAQIEEAMGDK